MLRAGSFFLGSLFLLAPLRASPQSSESVQVAPETHQQIILKNNTPVALITRQWLSSEQAKKGDRIELAVSDDVRVDGLVVIRRGATVLGTVRAQHRRRVFGQGGFLQVELDSVPLVSGQKVNLHGRFVAHGKEWENKALQNLAEANVVPGDPVEVGAGILFIFWFASSRGKEADLNIGTKVVASVDGDISLDRAAFEHLQEPQPPKTPGMAAVYIFRSPSSTGGLIDPAIYCGNVQLAAIKNGSFLKVFLPPATYWFHAGDERGVSLRVDDGQDYYLSVAMTIGNSGFSFVGDLTEVTAGNAKDRLANLPALDPQQVTDLSKVDPSALRVAMPE